jgi:eukaryotic-like serine/threonine-protein kinase
MSERWDRVTAVFGASRALSPQLRDDFLRLACEGDDTLRADVDALLAADEEDGFLEDAPWAVLRRALVSTSLSPGQVLKDRYRVEDELAAGGQALLYRATDGLLGRPVVIKLLRAEGWQQRSLKSRVEHEMQALAKITHPGVVGILDVGELEDGTPFLVIQHIPGITLRAAISEGPLSRPRAAAVLRQIGATLEAAHAHGIAHLDLKPENIMLQPLSDGTELVKLIDFGIARVEKSSSGPHTRTETVAGTIRYMAPEQLRGEHSRASDIYALAMIACEILSGRPDPFASELPPSVREHVHAALAYRPQDRPEKASLLCNALADALTGTAGEETARRAGLVRRYRPSWRTAALLSAGIAVVALLYVRTEPTESRPVDLSLSPPEGTALVSIAVSPDSRRIAVTAADAAGKTQLWVRSLASLTYVPLAGTEGADSPFWSADSRHVGFFAGGKLKRIDASGGPAQTICNAETGSFGGTWSRDDVILFTPNPARPLYRVSATGGEPAQLTTLDPTRGESSHGWPQFLPDGRHFLFFVESARTEVGGIYVASLDSLVKHRVLAAGSNGLYASGRLLFVRDDTLMAQPFDIARAQLTGAAVPLADDPGVVRSAGHSLFSASDDVLAYSRDPGDYSRLVWFDRAGHELGALGSDSTRRTYGNVNLSPDGTRIAADGRDPRTGNRAIWLYDLAQGGESRLTFGPATDASPVWSPDGRRITFFSARDGTWNLYQKPATGAGTEELLLKSTESKITCDWSLDGRYIVYREWDPKAKWNVWALPVSGEGKPVCLVQTPFEDGCGQVSPDGRWLAYSSGEPGRQEVYVQPFSPGSQTPGRWQVSVHRGSTPRWRRDGKELFYLDLEHRLMAVPVTAGGTFQAGPPKPLFQTRATGFLSYGVTANGQRFLVNAAIEAAAGSTPTVILNWNVASRP